MMRVIALALLPTAAVADYNCMLHNSATYSHESMGWFQTESIEAADATARNYVVASNKRVLATRSSRTLERADLYCFDQSGSTVIVNHYVTEPLCDINAWSGTWNCDEYTVNVTEFVQ